MKWLKIYAEQFTGKVIDPKSVGEVTAEDISEMQRLVDEVFERGGGE